MANTHFTPTPILHLSLLLLLSTASAQDAMVMSELKKGLTFPNKNMWSDPDPCNWEKVQCQNKRITRIQIGDQNAIGTLTANLNQLTELIRFEVMRNKLTGDVPSFSGLSNLQVLLLNENNFTSLPDDCFKGCTSLQTVSLDKNPFQAWQIPDSLKDASALTEFTANGCNVTGTIPDFFGPFASLTKLVLSYNSLEGGLPGSFSGSSIQTLWLNGQNSRSKLNGSIAVIGNMTSLKQVWLQSNAFTGPIPDVSQLISLSDFNVRDNQLTGPVPDSLVNLGSLKNVTLTNNMLQGKMPKFAKGVGVDNSGLNKFCLNTEGAECDSRVYMFLKIAEPWGYPAVLANDWNGNDVCSWAPDVTCDSVAKNVTMINLQNKQLSGTISPYFSNITTVHKIYLNNNSLSGTIPSELASMPNLVLLDISYNYQIYGQLPSFSRSNVLVNHNGTRIGLNDPGIAPSGSPGGSKSNGTFPESKKSKSIDGIVGGTVAAVFVFFAALAMCFFVLKRKHTSKEQKPDANNVVIHPRLSGSDPDIKITIAGLRDEGSDGVNHSSSGANAASSDVHVVEHGHMVISIQVLRNVTNNFSEKNILGSGGFGTVYKGELHDGTKIAVKRMESGAMSDKGLNEFQAEIDVLTKVRHRHLVALLGYCLEGNEKLLVYEYMPQGTLSSHIFNWAKENLKPLEWSRRLTIALDVARGVEYLHNLAHQSFVHRDLKPSNILLGDDMRAKVADFGLVRLAPDGKMSFATKLAGTFGYLAPEYAVTGRVTTKVDVFSFGVILMELITGRRALDDSQPDESCHLVTWFRRMSIDPNTFTKAIDPVLELTEETLSSIRTVTELAGHCSARDPHQRPDMSHVVNVLSSLTELWKPTEQDAEDVYGIDLDMTLPQALKKWQQFEGNSNADFSSSSFFGTSSGDNTQTSIPTRPYGFGESFTSSDGR